MKVHELKLDEKYFNLVERGIKPFEIRKNDRDYHVGDLLALSRYDSNIKSYVRRVSSFSYEIGAVKSVHQADTIFRKIIYLTYQDQKDGYVILGLGKLSPADADD